MLASAGYRDGLDEVLSLLPTGPGPLRKTCLSAATPAAGLESQPRAASQQP